MRKRGPRRLDTEALWAYALRALSGRAHAKGELREKLRRRAERMEDVDPVLRRLKQYGYLDDLRFAEHYAALRLENQGFGKIRVLQDLRRRRVAPAVAERAVEGAYRDSDETHLIEEFLLRKYRKVSLSAFLAEPKNLAAAYRKLRHAGFSSGNAIQVLKRFAKEPELLESLEPPEEEELES